MVTGHTAGGYWSYFWWVLVLLLVGTSCWWVLVILLVGTSCWWVLVILLVGTGHTAGGYWSYCWWVLIIVMVGTGQPHPDGNSQGSMPNHTTAEFIDRPSFVSHVFLLLHLF